MASYTQEEYRASIQKLYPPGIYFEQAFDDPESELSLYVDAMAAGCYRYQSRALELLKEAYPDQAVELISDYERVFDLSAGNTLKERQNKVVETWIGMLFRPVDWNKIGEEFSFTLTLDRQRTFCCESSLLEERLWDISARSFLVFIVEVPSETSDQAKLDFETKMRELSPPNYYLDFEYEEVVI